MEPLTSALQTLLAYVSPLYINIDPFYPRLLVFYSKNAEIIVWTYEHGGQDEVSYKAYVNAKLVLKKSAKHPYLQTHKGGKEV